MAKNYQVAIVGRVNVGKSTLFNKLLQENLAIVSPVAGTTRDRHQAICTWRAVDFLLTDTGGLERQSHDEIDRQISEQAEMAIDESDLVIFLTDGHDGVMPRDRELAKMVKTKKKKVILAVNKSDSQKVRQSIDEFYQLGLGDPVPIAARSGVGTGDLLDVVIDTLKKLPPKKGEKKSAKTVKLAIIGKPNVGKSSLINSILGQPRLIVSDIPHTTRDAQNIFFKYEGYNMMLVDTAGMRRQSKRSHDSFEKQSIEQAMEAIDKADIVLLVTDVSKRLSFQDKHLIDQATRRGAGLIVVANKWDLIPDKDNATVNKYNEYYRSYFPFISWAPLLFTSATENIRTKKILDTAIKVFEERQKVISDNALSKLLHSVIRRHKPSRGRGVKQPYIYTLKQTGSNPPAFCVKVTFKSSLHESYLRFIENNIRFKFGFDGVPLKIYVEKAQNQQDTL